MRRIARLTFAAVAMIVLGCQKDGKDNASISLEMDNIAGSSLRNRDLGLALEGGVTTETTEAEYVKLKIISVDLVRNDNKYVAVWVNPDCSPQKWDLEDGGKTSTGKPSMADYYNAENCLLTDIDTYIDISQETDVVNEELNSQSWPVPPGTYTEVSIRMCNLQDEDNDRDDALVFKATEMSEEKEVHQLTCGVTGAPTANIEVGEGVAAKINLEYDSDALLAKNVSVATIEEASQSEYCYYADDGLTYYCSTFGAETFVPTLVTE